jgi:hypothetical protein
MRMSMSVTSGRSRRACVTAAGPSSASPTTSMSGSAEITRRSPVRIICWSWRRELLDRCLVWNEHHLLHALREYEHFYNRHRAHQAPDQAAPLRPASDPITGPGRITDLNIRRRDRLGGVLHEYSHAA